MNINEVMKDVKKMKKGELMKFIGQLNEELDEIRLRKRSKLQCFDFPKEKEIKVIPLGDIHYGARSCDVKLFEGTLDYIKKSGSYVIGMGDYLNNATMNSVSNTYEDMSPEDQFDNMVEYLSPIRKQILALLTGNHEERTYKEIGFDLTRMLASKLGVPYMGYAGFIKLRVGKNNYSMYVTHGASGASTPEGKLRAIRRLGESFDADVYCFDEETEILTTDGWKKKDEVNIGDIILNLNLINNKIEKDVVLNKIETEEKESYNIEMSSISQCLSPNQRMIYKYKGEYLIKPAKELAKLKGQIKIPLTGIMDNKDYDLSDDEIRLVAWIISEGHFKNEHGAHKAIMIYQRKGEKANEITSLLERLKLDFSIYIRGKEKLDMVFYIKAKQGEKIRELISEKDIPDWINKLSKRQFDIFLETLIAGDGHKHYDGVYEYYSANEKLIDKLQAACTIFGYRTRKLQRISGFANTVNYTLGICNRQDVTLALSKNLIEHRMEDKKMWDVTTFNGTVIIRRNGKVSITGNCSGHTHDLSLQTDELRKIDYKNKMVVKHKRYYINTGHFLNYEGTYAEKKGYKPGKKGVAKIKFFGDKKDVHVSL